jgi:SAM-dependent methyltransferase
MAFLFHCILLTAVAAPSPTPSASVPSDAAVYQDFRKWRTAQPPGTQGGDVAEECRKVLTAKGLSPAEIDRELKLLREHASQMEIEMWNRVLTAPSPTFNTNPNAFLVEMTHGIHPGKALDVGMGQGRNALYLAQHEWDVTGFDPADKAVAAAKEQAQRLGLKLNALVLRDDQFDFGTDQWDLIVLSYVGLRDLLPKIYTSLKPGGLVVVEDFHRDATKHESIGGAVVFDTNELLHLFDRFRVLHYEDSDAVADFGKGNTRVVRLCAQKPAP